MKKLALFFDGTWNTPADRTNVYRLYKLTNDIDPNRQQATYIRGVGTEDGGLGLTAAFRNFLGGAFGDGLSRNICDGYKWLIQRYQEGDQIFLTLVHRCAFQCWWRILPRFVVQPAMSMDSANGHAAWARLLISLAGVSH